MLTENVQDSSPKAVELGVGTIKGLGRDER